MVQVEAAAMAEALATLAADVERLTCMSASVRAQLDGSDAVLSAVQATEAAIAAVSILVSQQHRTVAEALAAFATRIRPACCRF